MSATGEQKYTWIACASEAESPPNIPGVTWLPPKPLASFAHVGTLQQPLTKAQLEHETERTGKDVTWATEDDLDEDASTGGLHIRWHNPYKPLPCIIKPSFPAFHLLQLYSRRKTTSGKTRTCGSARDRDGKPCTRLVREDSGWCGYHWATWWTKKR